MDAAAAYEAVVEDQLEHPDVETGRMFGAECLKVRGKVFVLLSHDQLVAKLPADRVEALKAEGTGVDFGPGGRVMREWVGVPGHLATWSSLADEARAFVVSLPR